MVQKFAESIFVGLSLPDNMFLSVSKVAKSNKV